MSLSINASADEDWKTADQIDTYWRWFLKLPRLLGSLVIILGASGLLGWALNISALKGVFPGLVTMKANTALGMLLGGLGLALLSQERKDMPLRLCTAALAVAIALLGAVTLSEYSSGRNFWLDELLFRDVTQQAGTSFPGRMSPSTAFCLVLVGSALWVASQQASRRLRNSLLSGLSAALILIGGAVCIGQFSNALLNFQLWNYFGMAANTAAGFVLLGSGLLSFAKSEELMTWALGRRITGTFIVSIAIMITAAGLSWNYTYQLKDAAAWVSHTYQVLREIEEVRAGMTEMHNNQLGYLIFGDEHLLLLREKSMTEIRRSIETLGNLTSDNPHQKLRLDQLEPLIAQRVAFGERTILVRRQQGLLAAQRLLALGTDLALSNEIMQVLGAMRDEENSLLVTRERQAEVISASTFLLLPMAVFFSLTILSLALFLLNAGITERRSAEEISAGLAAIVNSSNDAIIGKDLNSIITSWNIGAERMFGYSAIEMIGQSVLRLIPSDRQGEEMHIIDQVKNNERIEHFETLRIAKDGRVIDVAATVSPIKDKAGKIVGASKMARDITDRKRAEKALYEGEKQFQTMINAIPQLAWIARADGTIFWYNQRWFDYTGTTLEQMEGWGWERLHDPDLLPKVIEGWKYSLENCQPFEMEFPLRAADGHYGWFLTRVFPLKDNAGIVVRWFGTNTDLSQKRAADEEIRELNTNLEERVLERTAELEAANKELEAFSYSVSHDLRAPLRAVDGFSQAVLEDYGGQLPEEGRRDLQTIREAAQRMGVLIDDLLKFSRLSRAPLHKQQVNTHKLVGNVLDSLDSQRTGRRVDIRIGELPDCQGDAGLINQVWVNLIANALKYTRRRETSVIEIGCKFEQGENIYFVRDNGAGFNMRYVDKLFGVFQRLHRADEFEGTGVGLAIVQRIIHRHGGRIWADAVIDQGATFSFTLQESVI
jgi:PAS domain S-box-containing protein